jgi:hypothetical protein
MQETPNRNGRDEPESDSEPDSDPDGVSAVRAFRRRQEISVRGMMMRMRAAAGK